MITPRPTDSSSCAVRLGLVSSVGRKLALLPLRLEHVDVREVGLEVSLTADVACAAVEGSSELRNGPQRDKDWGEAVLVKQLMHLGLLRLDGDVLQWRKGCKGASSQGVTEGAVGRGTRSWIVTDSPVDLQSGTDTFPKYPPIKLPPCCPIPHLLVNRQHIARQPLRAVAEGMGRDSVGGAGDSLPAILAEKAQHPRAGGPLGVEHDGVVVQRDKVGVNVHGRQVIREVDEVHAQASLVEVAAEPLVALAVGGEAV